MPCERILPAGGFIRYPRVRIRMEKSIAVSVYGGFSRDRLPETGRNGAAYFFRIDTVFWERDISTVPVQQRQSWLMAVSIQHILSKVLQAILSYMRERSGPDEKYSACREKGTVRAVCPSCRISCVLPPTS